MKSFQFNFSVLFFSMVLMSCQQSKQGNTSHSYDVETRIDSLGIQLYDLGVPVANYVHVVQTGNLLFLAGKGPKDKSGNNIVGRIGDDLTLEQGYDAARRIGIAQLSVLKSHLGDLNKVKRVVKVLGMVRCTDEFTQQSQVINGFSDLMVEVFGDNGKHARAAVGMNALPGGICAEIEMIVEIE